LVSGCGRVGSIRAPSSAPTVNSGIICDSTHEIDCKFVKWSTRRGTVEANQREERAILVHFVGGQRESRGRAEGGQREEAKEEEEGIHIFGLDTCPEVT